MGHGPAGGAPCVRTGVLDTQPYREDRSPRPRVRLPEQPGSGKHRPTLGGVLLEYGEVHCRAKAKAVREINVEVRRKTLLDQIISRGVRVGDAEFDAKYVALGKEQDVRRFLSTEVVKAFVGMWSKTEGLC